MRIIKSANTGGTDVLQLLELDLENEYDFSLLGMTMKRDEVIAHFLGWKHLHQSVVG